MADLVKKLGIAIHHFGGIENLVNVELKRYSKDEILVESILRYGLHAKADILQRLLLRDGTSLDEANIKRLTNDIKELAKSRNILAHNPILELAEGNPLGLSEGMEVVYYYDKKTKNDAALTEADIERLIDSSRQLLMRLGEFHSSHHKS